MTESHDKDALESQTKGADGEPLWRLSPDGELEIGPQAEPASTEPEVEPMMAALPNQKGIELLLAALREVVACGEGSAPRSERFTVRDLMALRDPELLRSPETRRAALPGSADSGSPAPRCRTSPKAPHLAGWKALSWRERASIALLLKGFGMSAAALLLVLAALGLGASK